MHAPRVSSGEAVRRENEGLSRLVRGHLRVSLFFLDGPRKKRLLVVYVCEAELVLCVAIHAIRETLSCRLEKLCSIV